MCQWCPLQSQMSIQRRQSPTSMILTKGAITMHGTMITLLIYRVRAEHKIGHGAKWEVATLRLGLTAGLHLILMEKEKQEMTPGSRTPLLSGVGVTSPPCLRHPWHRHIIGEVREIIEARNLERQLQLGLYPKAPIRMMLNPLIAGTPLIRNGVRLILSSRPV